MILGIRGDLIFSEIKEKTTNKISPLSSCKHIYLFTMVIQVYLYQTVWRGYR
jgi:hypothetical protein